MKSELKNEISLWVVGSKLGRGIPIIIGENENGDAVVRPFIGENWEIAKGHILDKAGGSFRREGSGNGELVSGCPMCAVMRSLSDKGVIVLASM